MKKASNKIKRSTGPSLIRMISVLFGVIIATVPFHIFAKQTANDTSLNAILLSFASGIIAASLLATIVEWTVHRFAMHRGKRFPLFRIATELHHKAHHWVHYTPNKYIATKPLNRPSVLAKDKTELCESKFVIMLTTLSHGAFYTFLTVPILVAAWKITFNFWFTAAMVFAASIFIYLFIRVHDAVHHPGLSFLENFKWFWFLDKHHYIHHIDNNVNTNFLLPLTDLLMGTLRQNMTLEEKKMWPSYTETRQA
tara:strand:- start:237 stop:995 length:759 start_codon:yes stop_codon:yes gene_type:complete